MEPRRPTTFFKKSLSIAAVLFIMFGVMGIYWVPKVHAVTNNIRSAGSFICNGSSSCTNSGNPSPTAGDLIVITQTCIPSGSTINSITDTASDSFSAAIANTITASNNATYAIWYTVASATGAITITINFAISVTACAGNWGIWDTGSMGVGNSASFTSLLACTVSSSCPARTMQSTAFTVTTSSLVIQVPMFDSITCNRALVINPTMSGGSPLLLATAQSTNAQTDSSCPSSNTKRYQPGNELNWVFNVNSISAQSYSGTFATFSSGASPPRYTTGLATVIFTPTGLSAASCTNNAFGNTIGGYSRAATTMSFTSNQTYLYSGQTGTNGGLINNVTTRLSSVSLTNSQTQAVLTLLVYTVSNLNAVSSGNPALKKYSQAFTVTNNPNAQSFSVNPSVNVPANAQYFIAMGISHEGAVLFRTSLTVSFYGDNTDAFVNRQPPSSLNLGTTLTVGPPAPFLAGMILLPCTVTTTSISTAAVSTSVQLINAPPPNSAAFWFVPMFFILMFLALVIGTYVMLMVRR